MIEIIREIRARNSNLSEHMLRGCYQFLLGGIWQLLNCSKCVTTASDKIATCGAYMMIVNIDTLTDFGIGWREAGRQWTFLNKVVRLEDGYTQHYQNIINTIMKYHHGIWYYSVSISSLWEGIS